MVVGWENQTSHYSVPRIACPGPGMSQRAGATGRAEPIPSVIECTIREPVLWREKPPPRWTDRGGAHGQDLIVPKCDARAKAEAVQAEVEDYGIT